MTMTVTMTMHRDTVTVGKGPRCHQGAPHQTPNKMPFHPNGARTLRLFSCHPSGRWWWWWIWGPGWHWVGLRRGPSPPLRGPGTYGGPAYFPPIPCPAPALLRGGDREGSGTSPAPHTHPWDLAGDNPSSFHRQEMSLGRRRWWEPQPPPGSVPSRSTAETRNSLGRRWCCHRSAMPVPPPAPAQGAQQRLCAPPPPPRSGGGTPGVGGLEAAPSIQHPTGLGSSVGNTHRLGGAHQIGGGGGERSCGGGSREWMAGLEMQDHHTHTQTHTPPSFQHRPSRCDGARRNSSPPPPRGKDPRPSNHPPPPSPPKVAEQ